MGIELQVGVKIALKSPEGKFLLMRRAFDPGHEVQHKFDIPGGRINPGSTLMENLAREVEEETGLRLIGTPRLLAAQDIMPKQAASRHVVRLTYSGEASEGEPRLSEEHIEYRWVTLEEMRSLENLDRYFRELVDAGLIG